MHGSSVLLRSVIIITLLTGLLGGIGCNGGGGIVTPNDHREYGPPLNSITFVEGSGHLGTASPTPGTTARYVPHVGSGKTYTNPGYSVLWRPGSSLDNPYLLIFDSSAEELVLIDGNGTEIQDFERGVADLFDFNLSGARLAYVSSLGTSQQLMIEAVLPITDLDQITELDAPNRFASRPAYNTTIGRVAISEFNTSDHASSRIAIYNTSTATPSLTSTIPGRNYSPRFNDTGSLLAYIEGPNGDSQATELVVVSSSTGGEIVEEARFNFGPYGTGACAFSWSPDDSRIAMFVDVYTNDPKLVIFDLGLLLDTEIHLPEGVIAVDAENHPTWCFPEWNPSGDALTFFIEVDEKYDLIKTDLDGNTEALVRGISKASKPNWLDVTN